jgi:hypothetical protein
MKRVKMIVTSVIVLAIVGSAFAFNAKKIGGFCVTTASGSGNCYTIFPSKITTGPGVSLKYDPAFLSGDPADCKSTSACSTQANFLGD